MADFIKDWLGSAKSKRVIAATLTAFFVATADELGVSQEAALSISALCVSLIIGDSIRPVSPGKYKTETEATNGQAE